MPPSSTPPQATAGEAGFSLVELVVASAVMAEVLLIVLLLFDVNGRVSRVQTELADLQQSQRVAQDTMVRLTRMAGRGGLQRAAALVVTDNVPSGTTLGGETVPDETDILTIRGIFSNPIFQVDPTTFTWSSATNSGTIQLQSFSPDFIPQSLDGLKEMVDRNMSVPLLVTDAQNSARYAVVEVTGGSWSTPDLNGDGTADVQGVLNFVSSTAAGGTHIGSYATLSSGGAPWFGGVTTPTVAFAGVLEEYRFYIRDDTTNTGGRSRKLSRAQFFPGTNTVFPVIPSNPATPINPADLSNARVDIADNVMDLQVALAIDVNADGDIDENPAQLDNDEWMLNHASDDLTWPGWANDLFQARITTLVRTDRPDPGYMAEAIDDIENRDYSEPAAPANVADQNDRAHRRRLISSLVDLRNI